VFLTEGLLLSLLSAGLGCMLAAFAMPLLSRMAAAHVPRWTEVGIDSAALGFAFLAAAVCGAICGLVPLLQVSRSACQEALRDGARGSSSTPANLRLREGLLAAEIALALVLTIGAGLLALSFARASRVEPGFRPDRLYRASLPFGGEAYAQMSSRADLVDRLLGDIRSAPGVEAAAAVLGAPFANESSLFTAVLPGRPATDPKERHIARYGIATAGYFSMLGAPLVAGREFTEADARSDARPAIVNEAFIRQLYPEGGGLDREFIRPFDNSRWRIVGIVRDLRNASLIEAPQPEAYFPHRGNTYTQISLLVRVKGDPAIAAQTLRQALRKIDPRLPLVGGSPVADMMGESLSQRRFALALLLGFAIASALLAVAGVGALAAYTVSQRRYELGVRMALGATPESLVRGIVGRNLRPVALGLVTGLAGTLAGTRLLSAHLYQTSGTEPVVLATACALFAGVALLACWLPARRAARIDPIQALRTG
jgi:putative ABC transport system permease protein